MTVTVLTVSSRTTGATCFYSFSGFRERDVLVGRYGSDGFRSGVLVDRSGFGGFRSGFLVDGFYLTVSSQVTGGICCFLAASVEESFLLTVLFGWFHLETPAPPVFLLFRGPPWRRSW